MRRKTFDARLTAGGLVLAAISDHFIAVHFKVIGGLAGTRFGRWRSTR